MQTDLQRFDVTTATLQITEEGSTYILWIQEQQNTEQWLEFQIQNISTRQKKNSHCGNLWTYTS